VDFPAISVDFPTISAQTVTRIGALIKSVQCLLASHGPSETAGLSGHQFDESRSLPSRLTHLIITVVSRISRRGNVSFLVAVAFVTEADDVSRFDAK
jgi:hypothetical protein